VRKLHPQAAVLVHPESPQDVVDQADVVGSTTALIQAVQRLPNREFIVATDAGIFNKMRQLAPGQNPDPRAHRGGGGTCESCARCPWMAMNALQNLERVLRTGIRRSTSTRRSAARAVVPIQRMLDFARARGIGARRRSD
jgi:quinolinate synthase